MNKLYPLKFNSIYKEKIWGGNKLHTILNKQNSPNSNYGESWEISGVSNNISIVKNGIFANNSLEEMIEIYMGDLVGDKVYDKFGIEFPILIKFIDANDVLSIQVHPDDNVAKKKHNAYGKTEMWYIIQTEKNAELISGFNCKLDKKKYLDSLKNKTLKDILNIEKTNKDDVFFIPPGRVHAIGEGILLAEIQQTSDITYRIYDWDRVDNNNNYRELHTDLAIDVLDFKQYDNYKTNYSKKSNETNKVVDCDYFTTSILDFDKKIEKDYTSIDSFVIYMCIEGNFDIIYNKSDKINIVKGETVLIPASLQNIILNPNKKSKIIETYIS